MKIKIASFAAAIIIITVSLCSAIPAFAWTSASTGWYYDFDSVYAHFSMDVFNYYQNNTSASIDLGWSYYYIDNWDTDPGGALGLLRNRIWYGNGLRTDYTSEPAIAPGEYAVEYLTLGETTYSKIPAGGVIVDNLACEWQIPFNGSFDMTFYDDLSISVQTFP